MYLSESTCSAGLITKAIAYATVFTALSASLPAWVAAAFAAVVVYLFVRY